MEPSRTVPLTYARETYRLWFEYLKVALVSRHPEVIQTLKGSVAYYQPWEVTPETKFDPWWKTYRHLFAENQTIRSLEPGEIAQPNAGLLVLEIPLTQSATILTRQVKGIIQNAIATREVLESKSLKAKKAPTALYFPSEGSEPKLDAVREMLTVYRDVYLANPKLRGEALLDAAHALYLGRKNKRWAKVPMALQHAGMDDKVRAMRNLRRYIQKAEKVLVNVAGGQFPGEY
jgi:hypothetical protein